MKILCPAKLNLFLNIISKRDNGKHNLKLLNQTVNLYDEISFKKIKENKIIIESESNIPLNSSNSIYKVAELIKNKYNISDGFKFKVKKRIPQESGLGGESTDAAGTIILLNHIYNLKLSKKDMVSISKSIGSDVSYFIYSGFKEVSSEGEIIRKPKFNNKYSYYIVIKPNFGLKTKDMFNKIDKNKFQKIKLSKNLHNDFLEVVPKSILEIRDYLNSENILNHTLSGSGSSYYIALEKNNIKLYKKVKEHYKIYEIYYVKNSSGFIIKN